MPAVQVVVGLVLTIFAFTLAVEITLLMGLVFISFFRKFLKHFSLGLRWGWLNFFP